MDILTRAPFNHVTLNVVLLPCELCQRGTEEHKGPKLGGAVGGRVVLIRDTTDPYASLCAAKHTFVYYRSSPFALQLIRTGL